MMSDEPGAQLKNSQFKDADLMPIEVCTSSGSLSEILNIKFVHSTSSLLAEII
jgi:hypothetical protein